MGESVKAHLKSGIARYQWTNPNNIILAKNGSRFLRELDIDLAVLGAERANVNFTPQVRSSYFALRQKLQVVLSVATSATLDLECDT